MNYAVRLDFPPTVNTYYRRHGHVMHLSASGKRYKTVAALGAAVFSGGAKPLTGRLGVQIELSAPNKTRDTDIDNRIKAVLDALQGVAFENDSQIDQLIVKRLPIDLGGDGYADVIISELTATQDTHDANR